MFRALEEFFYVTEIDNEDEVSSDVWTLYDNWEQIVQTMENARTFDPLDNSPIDGEVAGYRRNVFAQLPENYKTAKRSLVTMTNVYAARAEQCGVKLHESFFLLMRLFMVMEELITLCKARGT